MLKFFLFVALFVLTEGILNKPSLSNNNTQFNHYSVDLQTLSEDVLTGKQYSSTLISLNINDGSINVLYRCDLDPAEIYSYTLQSYEPATCSTVPAGDCSLITFIFNFKWQTSSHFTGIAEYNNQQCNMFSYNKTNMWGFKGNICLSVIDKLPVYAEGSAIYPSLFNFGYLFSNFYDEQIPITDFEIPSFCDQK